METTVGFTRWIRTPEQAEKTLSPSLSQETIVSEFVKIVKNDPKVWAICAGHDSSGVLHIWTYVDSTHRKDRSPVYRAEWQMLKSYPDVPFDFNVVLLSSAKGQSEIDDADCVYRR